MREEFTVFGEFIRSKGLRQTLQRERILRVFLQTEAHVSVEDLYKLVKRQYPNVGYTTVYRTMRLLFASGLCGEIDFGDGVLRYEHKYGHRHHDHLICTRCGGSIEVFNPQIEKMQDKMAQEHGFTPLKHKLEIFGVCKNCKRQVQ